MPMPHHPPPVPSFYLDEDVSEHLVALLTPLGYPVTTTTQSGRKGTNDAHQLLFAAHSQRVLLIHNAGDFTLLHQAWTLWSSTWVSPPLPHHAGIFIIYAHKGIRLDDIVDAILHLIQRTESSEHRVFTWNRTDGWNEITDRR